MATAMNIIPTKLSHSHSVYTNLVNGENFDPSFIDINPPATLPTLTADGKSYQNTTDVISYLVANVPKPLSTPTSHKTIIQQVHEDQYDPNFALLLVRNDVERVDKASTLPKTFIENRQASLSQEHFANLKSHLYTVLPSVLPADGFIAGATPGEADLHVAWLTRISATSGATSAADALVALEKNFGEILPEVVRKYARAWIVRDSWKKAYAEGLH
ncbi:hypothetical protein DFS33DRAFT_1377604 [Desarmillaria ectypa]|nr:hypothetical protein DFS33DRAFT_1377604 [Desarmillaria ectypa]